LIGLKLDFWQKKTRNPRKNFTSK